MDDKILNKINSNSFSRLSFVHVLILWALSFFISQVVMADPDGSNIDMDGLSGLSQGVEVHVETFESEQKYRSSGLFKKLGLKGDLNLFSVANPNRILELSAKWPKTLKSGMRYLQYPKHQLKKYFSDQTSFYKTEKMSLVVLSAFTAASAVNWFVFADHATIAQKSFLVALSAVLYASIVVNVPSWQKLVDQSDRMVERVRRNKSVDNENQNSILPSISANLALFLVYNLTVQGILNWSNLSRLFDGDLIGLMLANSAIGVVTTGVWDATFRKWAKEGRITAKKLLHLNWLEGFAMTTMHALISIGINDGYIALALHGAAGLTSLIATSKRVEDRLVKAKERLNWTYKRSRISVAHQSEVFGADSRGSSTQMCFDYLAI